MILIVISDPIKGYDNIWVIGDDFADQTFNEYFIERTDGYRSYAAENYEVNAFLSSPTSSKDPSMLSRFRNALVKGIRQGVPTPKAHSGGTG